MTPRRIAEFAIGPVGAALLGFITLPLITWLFSKEDIGRVAMLQVATSFSILLFSLGLDQAYVREYHESGDRPALLKTAFLPGFLILLASSLLLNISPSFVADLLFGERSVLLSSLVVLCVTAAFSNRFLSLILRMQERGLAFSMVQLLPKIMLLLMIALYCLFGLPTTLSNLVLANAVAVASVCVAFVVTTRADWRPALRARISRRRLQEMLAFGFPLILGSLAYWGLTMTDKIFLRTLSSFDELGVYSVAVSFAAAAVVLQSVFSTVWAPTVYKWASAGLGPDKIKPVVRYVLLIALLLFALAGMFSWLVDFVLPKSYTQVKHLLVPCLSLPLFYTLSEATKVGIGVSRKTRYSMIASLSAFIINVLGNLAMIPKFGAAGAATSTAFSFWCFFVLRTEFSIRLWSPLPRVEMYSYTFLVMSLAILTALVGSQIGVITHVIWSLILLLVLVRYRRDIMAAVSWARKAHGGSVF